jgi:hydrogen peroxide-dependent heme synthase
MQDSLAPLTLEGYFLLHQMLRVRWGEWKRTAAERRREMAGEAASALSAMEKRPAGASAVSTLLGHKGDLMLIHFRPTLEDLNQVQLDLARLALFDFLEPTGSYVSVVELGLYEMTLKVHEELEERGLKPHTPEFDRALEEEMDRQRGRMKGRLYTSFPPRRYVCFYPMSKKRGEARNWYAEPVRRRAGLMREHGLIGRRYGEQVTQIISGSIGYDDWEWGVDLFADDPLVFKKLVYEMRFDEASSWYGEFGPFLVGLQFSASELPRLLEGKTPAFHPHPA